MLVLSMVTVANAGLVISVGGQVDPQGTITLAPSETVSIGVVGEAPQVGNLQLYLIATPIGGAALSSGGIVWSHQDTALSSFTYYTGTDEAHIMLLNGEGMNLGVDSALLAAPISSEISQPGYDGAVLDNIIFHCNASGNVTLTLLQVIATDTGNMDDEFNEIYTYSPGIFDTQVIHQIPEPFTMGLLGLGGLFLRRRSK
jgi:hypothetical protein